MLCLLFHNLFLYAENTLHLSMFLCPQTGLRYFLATAASPLNFGSFCNRELWTVAGCHGNSANRSYKRVQKGDVFDKCSFVKEERPMLKAASGDCWKRSFCGRRIKHRLKILSHHLDSVFTYYCFWSGTPSTWAKSCSSLQRIDVLLKPRCGNAE